jgi:hypothetical protein
MRPDRLHGQLEYIRCGPFGGGLALIHGQPIRRCFAVADG